MADTLLAADLRRGMKDMGFSDEIIDKTISELGKRDVKGLDKRVVASAKAMTAAGIVPDEQVRVFMTAFFVQLGEGGSGSGPYPRCPYCGAEGGGGHGGYCPGPALGIEPA